MTFKMLICDKIADEGIRRMEKEGCEITESWGVPKPQLPEIVGEYDELIVGSATKVNADLMANAKKLCFIGRAGEGLGNIDLKKAFVSGKVKAAAVVVFEEEPPKESKLLTLKNVIATPHIGAQTQESPTQDKHTNS